MSVRWLVILSMLLCDVSLAGNPRVSDVPRANDTAPALRKTESKYYWIYTDLDEASTREASLRLSRMGQEYAARTAGFSGAIRSKFPVYLFRNAGDYYTAGGMAESAGMFDGERLMIVAGREVGDRTWHTMQHEGFHQFAHAVIGGDLPTWADEGLAEYFGEGVWTGDGFVTGLVPKWRLQRVRDTIARDGFLPVSEILVLTLGRWNSNLAIEHYDQAWSMVHFLVHAENGRYRKAFSSFMTEVGKGRPAGAAWQRCFGESGGFEARWLTYWKELPDDPTTDAYDRATAATIGSFWGRALARKQVVADYGAFVGAYRSKTFQLEPTADDWLPASLLDGAIARAERSGVITFEAPAKGSQRVVLTRKDGCRAIATVTLQAGKVKDVDATFDDTATVIAEAKRLRLLNEKEARSSALLKDALQRNPDSPLAKEVRELIGSPKALGAK